MEYASFLWYFCPMCYFISTPHHSQIAIHYHFTKWITRTPSKGRDLPFPSQFTHKHSQAPDMQVTSVKWKRNVPKERQAPYSSQPNSQQGTFNQLWTLSAQLLTKMVLALCPCQHPHQKGDRPMLTHQLGGQESGADKNLTDWECGHGQNDGEWW